MKEAEQARPAGCCREVRVWPGGGGGGGGGGAVACVGLLSLSPLAQGYFLSKNCLREVQRALEGQKPLILVHESDPNRGGTVEAIRDRECPDELKDRIFGGQSIIEWYRLRELQLVSMLMIAEQTLLATPKYRGQPELSLFIPGGLLKERLVFPQRVVLYISPHNPGAPQLGLELQTKSAEPSASRRRKDPIRNSSSRRARTTTTSLGSQDDLARGCGTSSSVKSGVSISVPVSSSKHGSLFKWTPQIHCTRKGLPSLPDGFRRRSSLVERMLARRSSTSLTGSLRRRSSLIGGGRRSELATCVEEEGQVEVPHSRELSTNTVLGRAYVMDEKSGRPPVTVDLSQVDSTEADDSTEAGCNEQGRDWDRISEEIREGGDVGDAVVYVIQPPTHFLLYLNDSTFARSAGRRLADEVRTALR